MSALAIIPDGALLIRDGRIEDVGPTRRIERLKAAHDAVEVDATGSVVIPGFIDNATRPVYAQAAGESFEAGIRAFSDAKKTVLEDNAASVLSGMVRHGTLATEVLTGYGGDTAGELRLMRIYSALDGRSMALITSLFLRLRSAGFRGRRSRLDHTGTAAVAGKRVPREALAIGNCHDGP